MNETVQILIGIISTTAAIIGWLSSATKGKKKEKLVKIAKILQKLPTIIKDIEKTVGDKNGSIKKTLVLNQIQIECNNNKIEYKEDEWITEIEKILETPQKKEGNEIG